MTKEVAKMVIEAHNRITRRKGKEYSPTAFEIEKEIKSAIFKTNKIWKELN